MRNLYHRSLLLAAAACGLVACGGGSGGGSGIVSTPPPTPTPTPTPTPPPVPPIPSGPIGLQSNLPFATFSARLDQAGALVTEADAVKIEYSAADGLYTVTLPGFQEGKLVSTRGANGSYNASGWLNLHSTISDLTLGNGPATQVATVTLDWPASSEYTYTSFGGWFSSGPFVGLPGVFAYGIPTAGADMPVTGAAAYNGEIRGFTEDLGSVFGSVFLSFDFAAGTLSGNMKPEIAPVWDVIPLGTFTFRDTVYSTGGLTFSGAFNVPGLSGPSSFSGSFTGPQASELMAKWQAPFSYPGTTQVGSMSGVWIGKKN